MANERDSGTQMLEYMELVNRRGFLKGAAMAGVASFLAACAGNAPAAGPSAAAGGGAFGKPLKAAMSNAGLGATWCAQGKATAEQWGKWLGV